MGPKKEGKRKGKKKGGAVVEVPSGPTPGELQAQIADLTTLKLKEEQDRNTMQLERDKISSFWEVKKKEYDILRAEFRNKDRAMEELEERHQLEIKVYNQKMKHLLYEQQNMIATIKADNEQALKLQREQFSKREGELVNDKRGLKERLKEMELSYEDTIRAFKLEHAKEITKMRQEFDLNAKELQQKSDRKIKNLRDECDLRRKQEIHEIEERKNVHVNELMRKHEKAFTEIKCYYNDITHNNLDLIKTLKEDVTDMKKKEAANEKLMYEIAHENKRFTEPLTRALKEVEELRRQLVSYDKDKILLAGTSSALKDRSRELKNLEWDHQVLQERCDRIQLERDELYAKFESSIYEVQQKCGLKSLLLQRKVQVLGEKLEKKLAQELVKLLGETSPSTSGYNCREEAQLGEAGVKLDANSGIENVLESKNNLIKSLQYDLGKITKAHNDIIKAFEMKLAEYGIPLEEMGLAHYISKASD